MAGHDLVAFSLPDSVHGEVCPPYLDAMEHGSVAGFLHGFSVHFGLVRVPAPIGVVMVAPKGPGTALRERFLQGMGIPCLLAIHQGGSDPMRTRNIADVWAAGIGCTRAGLVETTFKDECETDLFGEQSVLCGGMLALMRAAYETLVEAGYPPLLAYTECVHEVKQVADLVCDRGIVGMSRAISPTAKFGAMVASERIDDARLRATMRGILAEVRDGSFARNLIDDARSGGAALAAFDSALASHPMEREGEKVRAMLPWLRKGSSAATSPQESKESP